MGLSTIRNLKQKWSSDVFLSHSKAPGKMELICLWIAVINKQIRDLLLPQAAALLMMSKADSY